MMADFQNIDLREQAGGQEVGFGTGTCVADQQEGGFDAGELQDEGILVLV